MAETYWDFLKSYVGMFKSVFGMMKMMNDMGPLLRQYSFVVNGQPQISVYEKDVTGHRGLAYQRETGSSPPASHMFHVPQTRVGPLGERGSHTGYYDSLEEAKAAAVSYLYKYKKLDMASQAGEWILVYQQQIPPPSRPTGLGDVIRFCLALPFYLAISLIALPFASLWWLIKSHRKEAPSIPPPLPSDSSGHKVES